MNPPENAPIISVDEKTQMQVLSHDLRRPMKEGSLEQIDSHYHRHGVLSLYAALFFHSGKVVGKTETRHSHTKFISFLEIIRNEVANEWEKDIHVICDNLSAHKTEEITEWLSSNKRFHLHLTPTHASWLN